MDSVCDKCDHNPISCNDETDCPGLPEINRLLNPQKADALGSAEFTLLGGRTAQEQRAEVLDRMKYFYMQTDGSYKWPNSAEGDLLHMVYKLIAT